jgi:hypothetical protein
VTSGASRPFGSDHGLVGSMPFFTRVFFSSSVGIHGPNVPIKSYVSRCGSRVDNCSHHNNLTIKKPAWTVSGKHWKSWLNRTASNGEGHKKDTSFAWHFSGNHGWLGVKRMGQG